MLPFAEGDLPSYSDQRLADLLAQVQRRSATRQRRRRRTAQTAAAAALSLVAWMHEAPAATAYVHATASAPIGALTSAMALRPVPAH